MLTKSTQYEAPQADAVARIVEDVRHHGFAVVPQVFSAEQCGAYCEILERVLAGRVRDGLYFGSRTTQIIYNYFVDDHRLFDLFAHPLMETVMARLIDPDFVLISPSARNPRVRSDLPEGRKTSGEGWHVDSRVVRPETGDLVQPSLSYYSVVVLEPFDAGNAATRYVPDSHLQYRRPPSRDADYGDVVWEADAGSVVFFDSALWHRAGEPTPVSRWSIFNMYGPWYMKPYFAFRDNFTADELLALPRNVQRMLHLMSTPPSNDTVRTSTVTAEPVIESSGKHANSSSAVDRGKDG